MNAHRNAARLETSNAGTRFLAACAAVLTTLVIAQGVALLGHPGAQHGVELAAVAAANPVR